MKTCAICGEDKPLSEFYKRKGSKDGHENLCKVCRIAKKNGNNGKCKACGGERDYGKLYCETCRREIRKYERRNQNQIYHMRNNPDYTPQPPSSECDKCPLCRDCRYLTKQNKDPYCFKTNRYYFVYEKAREERMKVKELG